MSETAAGNGGQSLGDRCEEIGRKIESADEQCLPMPVHESMRALVKVVADLAGEVARLSGAVAG